MPRSKAAVSRAPAAVEAFISYAHADERLKNKLLTHLQLMQRQGLISAWHDRDITAGSDWKGQIDVRLSRARLVLLLVSPDFLASDYCYDMEMTRALRRHKAGRACVIPIFLRPCDWKGAPFGKLQGLPTDAHPVTSRRWKSQDEAFTLVAQGVRTMLEEHQTPGQSNAAVQRPTVPASPALTAPLQAPPSVKPKPSAPRPGKAMLASTQPQPAPAAQAGARQAATKATEPQSLSSTGRLVLLADRFYQSQGLEGHTDGRVEVRITPRTAEEEADLLALNPERTHHARAVSFAHQNQAFWARVQSMRSTAGTGRSTLTLTLAPEQDSNSSWYEMGYNGLSADQVAELRAQLLLLGRASLPETLKPDRFAVDFLSSHSLTRHDQTVALDGLLFPNLWQQTQHRRSVFLPQARLWAVFALEASGLCEHILELRLGPVTNLSAANQQLAVRFRGRRVRRYSNQEAAVIEVAGSCPLSK